MKTKTQRSARPGRVPSVQTTGGPPTSTPGRAFDLVGQVFGRLTVIKRSECKLRRAAWWECKCECGNITHVTTGNLTRKTRSCGCLQRELNRRPRNDLTGRVIGRLTIIKRLRMVDHSDAVYACRCSCGNQCEVRQSNLVARTSKSCGCLRTEINTRKRPKMRGANNPNWDPRLSAKDRIYFRTKSAPVRRMAFKRDDYTCQVCGERGGVIHAHHLTPWTQSVALRYDINNLITVCKRCHRAYHRKFTARLATPKNFNQWRTIYDTTLPNSTPGRCQTDDRPKNDKRSS